MCPLSGKGSSWNKGVELKRLVPLRIPRKKKRGIEGKKHVAWENRKDSLKASQGLDRSQPSEISGCKVIKLWTHLKENLWGRLFLQGHGGKCFTEFNCLRGKSRMLWYWIWIVLRKGLYSERLLNTPVMTVLKVVAGESKGQVQLGLSEFFSHYPYLQSNSWSPFWDVLKAKGGES